MKIKFKTNLDQYRFSGTFPKKIPHIPRIGEKVKVEESLVEWYNQRKLPIRLEVIDVTYSSDVVEIELHYNELDLQIAQKNKAKVWGE